MATSRIYGDQYIVGKLSADSMGIPKGAVDDNAIAAGALGAYVNPTKLRHRNWHNTELFGEGITVAALNKWIHTVQSATGELVGLSAVIAVQATGADRTVHVDLQKSTAGGAFATVLSSTIGFTNTSVIRIPVDAVIGTVALVAGDILRLVVTVAGAAGAQAQGLLVTLVWDEDPQ
jgi:hypothetical protein